MKKGKKKFHVEVPVDVYSLEKHLYSLMFSGVYVSNVDIRKIMQKMGYECSLDARETMFEDLFERANKDGRKKDAYQELIALVTKRVKRYQDLQDMYPASSRLTDIWIRQSNKTIERMQDEMSRLDDAAK